jgi:transposase
MDRFIGIDVHSSSCTVAVMGPTGRRLRSDVVDTHAKTLIQYLQGIAGDKHVCIEEGQQAEWLYEVLSPHVSEVAVMNVRGMPKSEHKSDESDAFTRADDLRLGRIKRRVYKQHGTLGALRAVVRVYDKLMSDHVRAQNRVKSVFRARGIEVLNSRYPAEEQERLLKALPVYQRQATEMLFAQLTGTAVTRKKAEEALTAEAKKHAMTRVLMTMPGLGIKRIAQMMAIVIDPNRFRNKRQFWSYCGFAIQTRVSAEWERVGGEWTRVKAPMTRGLNRAHNRVLKSIFNGAAKTMIATADITEPLYQDYRRLTESGTKPDLARLTIARKIAATSLAMWKRKEVYNPASYRSGPESGDE